MGQKWGETGIVVGESYKLDKALQVQLATELSSHGINEISDEFYSLDDAMRAGYIPIW